jgi:nitrogen fixation NifU-like protein
MNTSDQELQSVYREKVLEHSRNPHNFKHPDNPDYEAQGFNPLCGDKVTVYLKLSDKVLSEVSFEGTGCAIAIASASMMTDALTGCTVASADALIASVNQMFKEETSVANEKLAEIKSLEGVRKYPSRIKCAILAWTAASAALHGDDAQVSTE